MKRFTIAVIVCALGCADASEPQLQPENESTPLFEFTDSEQETVTETRDEFVDTTWVAQRIGDATSTQDWWHFGESSEFHRSLVRLSEPNSLSLERFNGSWTYEAGTVFVEARSLTSEFEWTFTGHPDDDVLLTHSFVETAPQRFERSARVIERGDEFG